MVTLRMVAVALAILLGLPLLAAATDDFDHLLVEGGEVASGNAEAWLEATNVTLVEATAQYDRLPFHEVPEQLVEGHTVFLTIDLPVVRNVTNWTLDIAGDLRCATNVSAEGYYFWGIPNPTKVNRARVECEAAGRVFATPDPFYDSDNTFRSSLQPTGNVYLTQAPDGQPSFSEEYSFLTVRDDGAGNAVTRVWYAYASPVLQPWIAPDGTTKTWMVALPHERLRDMDVEEWTVVVDNDPRIAPALE